MKLTKYTSKIVTYKNRILKAIKLLDSIDTIETTETGSIYIKYKKNVIREYGGDVLEYSNGSVVRKHKRIMDNPDIGFYNFYRGINVDKDIRRINKKCLLRESQLMYEYRLNQREDSIKALLDNNMLKFSEK